MIIVAFGHESRVGKDTAAKLLDSALRVMNIKTKKVSFAAKLKQVSYDVYGWTGLKPGLFYESDEGAKLRSVKLPVINKTPVEIWIDVGNHFREIYENTWRDYVLNVDHGNTEVLIITDLRFPNEGNGVHEKDGICVHVIAERVPKMDSVSDRALDGWPNWDRKLFNEGDIKELSDKVDAFALNLFAQVRGHQHV